MSKLFVERLAFVAFISLMGQFVFAADDQASAANNRGVSTSSGEISPTAKNGRIYPLPEGYTEKLNGLSQASAQMVQAAEAASSLGAPLSLPEHKDLGQAVAYYMRFHGSCVNTQNAAAVVCREETSPELQGKLNDINKILSVARGMAINDACGAMSKAMNLAQAGLTAYTAACSAARASCEASCVQVKHNLDRILKVDPNTLGCQSMSVASPEVVQACTTLKTKIEAVYKYKPTLIADNTESDRRSIALKNTTCTYTYADMVLSAGLGILSTVKAFGEANKCDQETLGTAGTVVSLEEKCKDTQNATLPECICLKNPRTAGCSNGLQGLNENSASNLTVGATDKSNSLKSGDLGSLNLKDDTGISDRLPNSSDGGGLPGAPSGGSAALGGGGGGGSGGSGAQGEAAKKGLDANILGGAGGGGGGGSWGSFSGGGEKYRAYLPGGVKDPSKGMAGQQQNWIKEVTGQGGKSNWEKVKERYRDNTGTLLNN